MLHEQPKKKKKKKESVLRRTGKGDNDWKYKLEDL